MAPIFPSITPCGTKQNQMSQTTLEIKLKQSLISLIPLMHNGTQKEFCSSMIMKLARKSSAYLCLKLHSTLYQIKSFGPTQPQVNTKLRRHINFYTNPPLHHTLTMEAYIISGSIYGKSLYPTKSSHLLGNCFRMLSLSKLNSPREAYNATLHVNFAIQIMTQATIYSCSATLQKQSSWELT
jgi:hypothetical protein